MDSVGGFVGFGAGSLGRLVDVGVAFCGAGGVGFSTSCTTYINRHYAATREWLTRSLGWKYGQREPLHSPLWYFAHTGFLAGAGKDIMSR